MPGIRLTGTGKYLPELIVTNEDFCKTLDTSDEWITQRTGIKQRRRLGADESATLMAVSAAKEAIENAKASDENFAVSKIAAVITATMTGDYLLPSMSCIIQKELGLPDNIKAYDISAACTGFVYAIQSAYEILNLYRNKYVLVVGSEAMSKLLDYEDRSTCVLFGDGAGAAVFAFSESEDTRFIELSGTCGDTDVLYCEGRNVNGFVHMDGGAVYRFAVSKLKSAIGKLLDDAGLTMSDIDHVICHQANERIIRSVMKAYKGFEDKFYMNIDRYGNTSGASVALVLDDMNKEGLLKPGMKVITVAFGAGLSWCGAFMTI